MFLRSKELYFLTCKQISEIILDINMCPCKARKKICYKWKSREPETQLKIQRPTSTTTRVFAWRKGFPERSEIRIKGKCGWNQPAHVPKSHGGKLDLMFFTDFNHIQKDDESFWIKSELVTRLKSIIARLRAYRDGRKTLWRLFFLVNGMLST